VKFRRRKTWRNHTRNQHCDPLRICVPESLDDLVEVVGEARDRRTTVRAVGSGHSWSDAALTGGFLLEPRGLDQPLDLEPELLTAAARGKTLVRVEAGMRIRELNKHLDGQGLALSQMGGYDGQTVAGVISTSTHGSGNEFGPLSDFVRSLDLVAGDGGVYRIEPDDGPTDEDAYGQRYPERRLVKDDHWFRAAVVGIGCLGIVYAVVLEIEPEYWLEEVRRPSTWRLVKEDLHRGEVLEGPRHYEVYVNPHPRGGEHRCMVTTREKTTSPGRRPPDRRRNSIPEFLAWFPLTPIAANYLLELRPSLAPWLLDRALAALADERYVSASYRVFNIGTANLVPAYSSEIGVPVDDEDTHIEAVERIFEIAARHRELGAVYHTSPIALRFVAASSAYLSMMEGRRTMMIELIQMTRTDGGFELLAAYEDELYALGGRPHWGQVNTLTPERVASLYPRLDDWLDVRKRLNASPVFDGPLTRRVGF
jgi:hypothetical protein